MLLFKLFFISTLSHPPCYKYCDNTLDLFFTLFLKTYHVGMMNFFYKSNVLFEHCMLFFVSSILTTFQIKHADIGIEWLNENVNNEDFCLKDINF
jgi:hypothetical protein